MLPFLKCLFFSEKVVIILNDELVTVELSNFSHNPTNLPPGAIGGVVKENKTAGDKELIAILKITSSIVITMVTVYVAEADRATKGYRSIENINNLPGQPPRRKKVVG